MLNKKKLINKVKKIRINISLAKSANIRYRLKTEMVTDGVYIHCKIN